MDRDDIMRDTFAHIRRVGNLMIEVIQKLQNSAMCHDDSKFSKEEFELFAQETPGLKSLTYGSPEYRKALARLGPALENHYKLNRHHPEHHAKISNDIWGGQAFAKMDMLDLIEMLADWKAATERHADGDLRKSINTNSERFGYGKEIANLLIVTAERMGWIKCDI